MMENHPDEIDCEYVLDEAAWGRATCWRPASWFLACRWRKADAVAEAEGSRHGGARVAAHREQCQLVLIEALRKALDVPAGGKPNPVIEEMRRNIGEFAPNKFTSAIQRNTMSLTTLTSGVGSPVKVNVIPSLAEATLDCRLLPG